jgi:hypothetical protein
LGKHGVGEELAKLGAGSLDVDELGVEVSVQALDQFENAEAVLVSRSTHYYSVGVEQVVDGSALCQELWHRDDGVALIRLIKGLSKQGSNVSVGTNWHSA